MRSIPYLGKRPAGVVILALTLLLCLGGSMSPALARAETRLRVTLAEWKAEDSKLVVKGSGAGRRETVIFKDVDSLQVLGITVSGRSGRFEFEKTDVDFTPCRILVTGYDGKTLTVDYTRNPPRECGDAPPPAATLTGITISGPTAVDENAGAQYTCTAVFSDGTTAILNSGVSWSESSGAATISQSGYLTAASVTADQVLTVSATYNASGNAYQDAVAVTLVDVEVAETVTGSHAGRFTVYEGTRTCLTCHTNEALDVHASVHYQWRGEAAEALGLAPGDAGKLGGINDFCIYPDINWIGKLTNVNGVMVDGGCAKCHAGMGAKPDPNPTQAQLENIDCLVCHSDAYKRKVGGEPGSYRFVPDTANMGVGLLQAAVDITRPSKDSCLNCHTKAGGGNNFKRGDIEEFHRNPTREFDVHMASRADGGAGLACLDCHTSTEHKIAGRGTDLRPRESQTEVSCTRCHTSTPHNNSAIDKHTARIDCTVCHIPTFAKMAPTDMDRDWSQPGDLVEASGLFEPHHVKGANLMPEYRFFNGRSHFYQFGDPAVPGTNGRIVMSAPDGVITDPGAKIHAFKHHLGTQPIDPVTGRLLPLKIGQFFMTGDVLPAVAAGVAEMGWDLPVGYEFAETERFMGLFHEVAPKADALACNSCHSGGSRLDFDQLGYAPRPTSNSRPLCAACHEDKSDEWSAAEVFTKVHDKHVREERLDCNRCHFFTAAR